MVLGSKHSCGANGHQEVEQVIRAHGGSLRPPHGFDCPNRYLRHITDKTHYWQAASHEGSTMSGPESESDVMKLHDSQYASNLVGFIQAKRY